MDSERERREKPGPESVARAEAARRRARRTPDGVATGSEAGPQAEDVRSLVMQLADRVDRLTGELEAARRQIAELESRADEDAVLPVLNRRGLMREIGRAIDFLARYGTASGLIVAEADNFAAITGAYGHDAGDAVLKGLATCLRRHVRSCDVIGRLGPATFGIILWTASQAETANKAGELATAIAESAFPVAGARLRVSVSTGASGIEPGDTAERAVTRAGELMQAARRVQPTIRR